MISTKKLDEIAQALSDIVPPAARQLCDDLESNFKSILQAMLAKLDLVSREEFDAQKGVLERTRQKLTLLEKKVQEIKNQ